MYSFNNLMDQPAHFEEKFEGLLIWNAFAESFLYSEFGILATNLKSEKLYTN